MLAREKSFTKCEDDKISTEFSDGRFYERSLCLLNKVHHC